MEVAVEALERGEAPGVVGSSRREKITVPPRIQRELPLQNRYPSARVTVWEVATLPPLAESAKAKAAPKRKAASKKK